MPTLLILLIYDAEYHLDNITFNNNNNPVYTYFDDFDSTIGRIYGNDTISEDDLNNTYYLSVISGEGMKLNLTTNNIDLSILPTRFDLREIGWLTPVRDQGSMGSCWAFGGIAAFESALLKNTGIMIMSNIFLMQSRKARKRHLLPRQNLRIKWELIKNILHLLIIQMQSVHLMLPYYKSV